MIDELIARLKANKSDEQIKEPFLERKQKGFKASLYDYLNTL